jgi:hypothetical protein
VTKTNLVMSFLVVGNWDYRWRPGDTPAGRVTPVC